MIQISYCFGAIHEAWWVRINSLILHAIRTKPLFSERNGYCKFMKIPFCSWRIRLNRTSTRSN